MNQPTELIASVVDMVFPLTGRSLPPEYALPLQQALRAELPWLGEEPRAGVHPVKLAHGSGAQALLSGRSRLLLRLPRERVEAAGALAGRTLAVGDCPVRLGTPHLRELLPHGTLYAHAVAARNEDEADFVQWVAAELAALQLRAPWICGKRGGRRLPEQTVTTFSLMVHNLPPAESLRLQEQGLGAHRLLGCGIFVPHKTTAAVGEDFYVA